MGNTPNNNFPYPESSGLVKDGWEDIKDLATSIDTKLGVYAPSTSGLTLINTTSFSGVNSVSAPNGTFSATYDNYLIKFNSLQGSSNYANIRLRASGSDDSGANYRAQQVDIGGVGIDASRLTGRTSWETIFLCDSGFTNYMELAIVNPFAAKVTSGHSIGVRGSNADVSSLDYYLGLNTTTSYDSISIIATGITGSMSVYGFSK